MAQNADLFDSYFQRADLDRDGRISGAEAVSFFQASGLPKLVLAEIWDYADLNRTGFLRNALRLVTVAQSKRELTPELVKPALYGPAAVKIPAPQMNLPGTPASLWIYKMSLHVQKKSLAMLKQLPQLRAKLTLLLLMLKKPEKVLQMLMGMQWKMECITQQQRDWYPEKCKWYPRKCTSESCCSQFSWQS